MQSHFNGSSLRRPFSDESSDLASHFHAGPSSRRGGDDRDADDAIRGTDDDAIGSKLSAVELGYIDDPYAGLFSKSSRFGSAARKPPLINVGTHHRTWALDKLVDEFLASPTEDTTSGSKKGKGKQIVSLGAGSDTRFWRIADREPSLIKRYIEIDFPSMTSHKARRISTNKRLSSILAKSAEAFPSPTGKEMESESRGKAKISRGGTQLETETYALLPIDLRVSPPTGHSTTQSSSQTLDALVDYVDTSIPTLIIAECVFCYMAPKESADVLSWFASKFENVVAVVYEMCGLEDSFGKVMRSNLQTRGIPLPGATFDSPAAQASRFQAAGFDNAGAKSLKDIRKDVLPRTELERIGSLELLDEVEELELVLDHYCIAWGTKGAPVGGFGL